MYIVDTMDSTTRSTIEHDRELASKMIRVSNTEILLAEGQAQPSNAPQRPILSRYDQPEDCRFSNGWRIR